MRPAHTRMPNAEELRSLTAGAVPHKRLASAAEESSAMLMPFLKERLGRGTGNS